MEIKGRIQDFGHSDWILKLNSFAFGIWKSKWIETNQQAIAYQFSLNFIWHDFVISLLKPITKQCCEWFWPFSTFVWKNKLILFFCCSFILFNNLNVIYLSFAGRWHSTVLMQTKPPLDVLVCTMVGADLAVGMGKLATLSTYRVNILK